MRLRHIRLLAATGTAVTALALSACSGNGTGTKDEGASEAVSPTTSATAHKTPSSAPTATTPADAGRTNGTPVTRTHGSGTAKGGSGTTGGGSSIVLCNGANTRVTAQPVNRPLNHMLLTATNTGRKTCELTYYPIVRFDEMQWAPQADEETQPQAVTTLKPGESGYAMVRLSAADGSGEGGTTARKLTLMFQGTTPRSDGGATATPALPAKGFYYDSSLTVTYWQQSLDTIASW